MTPIALRGFLYLLLVAVVAELLFFEARTVPPERMYSEWSYTEWLQSLFLLLSLALLVFHARRAPEWRALAICMALAFGILLIRENDQFLELFLPHGSWKYLAAVLAVLGGVYFWPRRDDVSRQLRRYARTPAFGVLVCGFSLLVFSRLFGRSSYWKAVMDGDYLRMVKNAVEEGLELLALAFICMAMVEFVFFTPRENRGASS